MKKITIALLIAMFFQFLSLAPLPAQARKIVLLEEASNSSCGPCAALNPIFQSYFKVNFGKVISVRYRAWWPGADDPMYLANTEENRTRVQYYGIQGVPAFVVDGKKVDLGDVEAEVNKRFLNGAPVEIQIDADFSNDSLRSQVKIIGLADVSQSSLYLRTAIIERKITYSSPPGSNGEKVFYDIMRKMLPDANGTAIASINAGDTLNFAFSLADLKDWRVEQLAFVAWLQSDATKEIIQANMSVPTCIIESPISDNVQILSANSSHSVPMQIFNNNSDTLTLKLKFSDAQITPGWSYGLDDNSQESDSFQVTIAPQDTLHFSFKINPTSYGFINLNVFAENLSDPAGLGYGSSLSYLGVIPEGSDVLFVDDDGGENYENNFYEILNKQQVKYISIPEIYMGQLPEEIDISNYKILIWNVSWGFPAFSQSDISVLTNYLDSGGNLLLLGQDIGWDIHDQQYGRSNFSAAHDFYDNYLDAKYENDNSGGTGIVGVSGDVIGDSIESALSKPYGPSYNYPDWITSKTGKSKTFLNYNNGKSAGLRYDSGNFKTVYLGIGLEQIASIEARELLLERCLDWFNSTSGIKPSPENVPRRFVLEQNYPNPFNPNTQIQFQLPEQGQVEIKIFNLQGQLVRNLIDKSLPSGAHKIKRDGKDDNGQELASGMYYMKIKFKKNVEMLKMLKLK